MEETNNPNDISQSIKTPLFNFTFSKSKNNIYKQFFLFQFFIFLSLIFPKISLATTIRTTTYGKLFIGGFILSACLLILSFILLFVSFINKIKEKKKTNKNPKTTIQFKKNLKRFLISLLLSIFLLIFVPFIIEKLFELPMVELTSCFGQLCP